MRVCVITDIIPFYHSWVIPFLFKVQVDPADLIPKLPRPCDLRPFPTTQAIVCQFHILVAQLVLVRCTPVMATA